MPGVPQQNQGSTAGEKIGRDHGMTTKAVAVTDGHPVGRLAVGLAETVLDLAEEHAEDAAKGGGES